MNFQTCSHFFVIICWHTFFFKQQFFSGISHLARDCEVRLRVSQGTQSHKAHMGLAQVHETTLQLRDGLFLLLSFYCSIDNSDTPKRKLENPWLTGKEYFHPAIFRNYMYLPKFLFPFATVSTVDWIMRIFYQFHYICNLNNLKGKRFLRYLGNENISRNILN